MRAVFDRLEVVFSMVARIPFAIVAAVCVGPICLPAQTIDLPSGKQLIGDAPGNPQKINSLPMSMAISPDGRYVVTVNAGYGTYESLYQQSLTVLDTQTGTLADFPDARTSVREKQTLYSGLAFSRDGRHIYASMASLTNPAGDGLKAVGSGVAVYSFNAGKISPERLIPLPIAPLPRGRITRLPEGKDSDQSVPLSRQRSRCSARQATRSCWSPRTSPTMSYCLMQRPARSKSGSICPRATPCLPPIPLPWRYQKTAKRAFVALWNASEIVELDLDARRLGASWPAQAAERPSLPERIPAPSIFARWQRRFTWRLRIAMWLRP
jgi:hypothetical protein